MAEKEKLFLINSVKGDKLRYIFCMRCQTKDLGCSHLWTAIASKSRVSHTEHSAVSRSALQMMAICGVLVLSG